MKNCEWGVEGWVKMHSGVYNRVGGHPHSIENEGHCHKELKSTMNPQHDEIAFNKYNADDIEFYNWTTPKT